MVPHRMTAWNGWNTALCWGLTENDVSPLFTPLYHAGGLGAFLVPILAAGGTIVLHAGFDPAEVWATVAKERCTVVLGVPTIWKLLLEHPSFETADLSSIRWLISGGAPLPLYLIDAYQKRGVVFKQGYGLTEVGVNCFAMSVEESVAKKGSIGRPLMMTDAKLVDEAGAEVPVGEVGELCLRGPHVSKGYWRNLSATAAALDDDGFFHTGDLARKDADGFFTIAGRRKDMLICGRRQRLPGRDRRGAPPPPGRPGRGRRRRPRPDLGRGRRRVRRDPAGRGPVEAGPPRLRRGATRALQAAERGRLRRRPPEDGVRQGRQRRAAGTVPRGARRRRERSSRPLAPGGRPRRAAPPPERRDDELLGLGRLRPAARGALPGRPLRLPRAAPFARQSLSRAFPATPRTSSVSSTTSVSVSVTWPGRATAPSRAFTSRHWPRSGSRRSPR